jgi:hypothetical protein
MKRIIFDSDELTIRYTLARKDRIIAELNGSIGLVCHDQDGCFITWANGNKTVTFTGVLEITSKMPQITFYQL